MFKFLKEKLKNSISKLTKRIEEEGKDVEAKPEEPKLLEETKKIKKEVKEEITEKETKEKPKEEPKKKGFFSKIKDVFSKKKEEEEKKEIIKEIIETEKPIKEEKIIEKKEEKKELVKKPIKEIKELKKEEKVKPIKKFEEIKKIEKEITAEEKILEKEEIKKEPEKLKEEIREPIGVEKKEIVQKPIIIPKEEIEEKPEPEKKGFFSKIKETITTKKIDEKKFEELFWDLEVSLLENNVAVEVIEKIKEDLKKELVEKPLLRSRLEKIIEESLRKSLKDILTIEQIEFLDIVKTKKPFVICFVGVNGSGKTTTIAKIAHMLKKHNLSCVIAASDTFRAASIEQLQKHADNIGVKLIKHDYGSDPAAVAFDAIKHAQSKNIDVVLIDTAGRMHSNINLIDEMKKIVRVAKPDLKIFVGEAITGNDCVEQAKEFNNAIGIDAIILAKADVDEKGGAAISVSYVTNRPIIYLGVGQGYDDLQKFDSDVILNSLGLES